MSMTEEIYITDDISLDTAIFDASSGISPMIRNCLLRFEI